MSCSQLSVVIDNPFSSRKWSPIWIKYAQISKHFGYELNVYNHSHIIEFCASLQVGGDHQGCEIRVGILGYSVEFLLYDNRHSDDF